MHLDINFPVRPFDQRSASALLRKVSIADRCKLSAYNCQKLMSRLCTGRQIQNALLALFMLAPAEADVGAAAVLVEKFDGAPVR